jgi:hypothetical protein
VRGDREGQKLHVVLEKHRVAKQQANGVRLQG